MFLNVGEGEEFSSSFSPRARLEVCDSKSLYVVSSRGAPPLWYLYLNHKSLSFLYLLIFFWRNAQRKKCFSFSLWKKSETHVILCWWRAEQNFSSFGKARKSERNLYSEIVFMCAIIISNENVCVPFTSAWNRLHLSDIFSSFSCFGYKSKLGNIGFLSDDKLHAFPHTKWTLHFCAILFLPIRTFIGDDRKNIYRWGWESTGCKLLKFSSQTSV